MAMIAFAAGCYYYYQMIAPLFFFLLFCVSLKNVIVRWFLVHFAHIAASMHVVFCRRKKVRPNVIVPAVTPRGLYSWPGDVRPLQALGDGQWHGGEVKRFLLQRHRHRRGDGKHVGVARPRTTPGEPPGPLSHPHLTGETADQQFVTTKQTLPKGLGQL